MTSVKERIINSAYETFSEKGYVETTVKEISAGAGIAYGTVYFHFRQGKDDVLNKIFSFVMDQFYEVLNKRTSVETIEDTRMLIYNQLIDSFEIVNNNKRIMQVLWEAKGKSNLIYGNVLRLKEKFIHKISENILNNREKELTNSKDQLLIARAFMHMAWGFIWEYAFMDKYAAEEIAGVVTTIYVDGVYS